MQRCHVFPDSQTQKDVSGSRAAIITFYDGRNSTAHVSHSLMSKGNFCYYCCQNLFFEMEKPNKSSPQNKYFHVCYIIIAI